MVCLFIVHLYYIPSIRALLQKRPVLSQFSLNKYCNDDDDDYDDEWRSGGKQRFEIKYNIDSQTPVLTGIRKIPFSSVGVRRAVFLSVPVFTSQCIYIFVSEEDWFFLLDYVYTHGIFLDYYRGSRPTLRPVRTPGRAGTLNICFQGLYVKEH